MEGGAGSGSVGGKRGSGCGTEDQMGLETPSQTSGRAGAEGQDEGAGGRGEAEGGYGKSGQGRLRVGHKADGQPNHTHTALRNTTAKTRQQLSGGASCRFRHRLRLIVAVSHSNSTGLAANVLCPEKP
ncbi:hypothetical protein HYALB_00003519 [Hymenoscyphus albidus]|uniref:Uncharacterized protein n=1 Tax=Hymenoscyphus albidus TaxID=595503 RepID=A0A9N9LND5_9HELO|nr:hypothetical protein HYALB_00003519 [Hymenoscyphus albidus]